MADEGSRSPNLFEKFGSGGSDKMPVTDFLKNGARRCLCELLKDSFKEVHQADDTSGGWIWAKRNAADRHGFLRFDPPHRVSVNGSSTVIFQQPPQVGTQRRQIIFPALQPFAYGEVRV